MSSPQLYQNPFLFNEADLNAMVVEIDSARSVPSPRDITVEVREFHGWTLDKLNVLELYLKLYRRVAGGGAFIDAFAGTGRGILDNPGEQGQRDGSSLIAAKSGAFSKLHLIEIDRHNFQALEQTIGTLPARTASRISTYQGDCNQIIPELLSRSELDNDRPCFALFDQESTQLHWSTIEAIAGWKQYEPPLTMAGRPKKCKAELWILFNSHQAIFRLWPNDRDKYPESFSPSTLDRIFGSRDAWWDLWESGKPAKALVPRFAEQLKSLGYQYVLPQLIKNPETGMPQYHMIHATDHPSAVSFMRWAKRRTDGYEDQPLPGLTQ